MLKGENYTNQLYESYASRLAINTMINGECGIIDNYGNKMEVTYNNNIVTISNGMAVVKGGLIRETTYTTLNATLTDGLYYSVVLEIDLSQTNTRQEFNQGSFKLLSNNGSYPTLQQDDLSLMTNTGIYQMELARFQTSASAITNFTDTRNILSYNSLIQELRTAISRVIAEDLTANDVSYSNDKTVKQKIDDIQNSIDNLSFSSNIVISEEKNSGNISFSPSQYRSDIVVGPFTKQGYKAVGVAWGRKNNGVGIQFDGCNLIEYSNAGSCKVKFYARNDDAGNNRSATFYAAVIWVKV